LERIFHWKGRHHFIRAQVIKRDHPGTHASYLFGPAFDGLVDGICKCYNLIKFSRKSLKLLIEKLSFASFASFSTSVFEIFIILTPFLTAACRQVRPDNSNTLNS